MTHPEFSETKVADRVIARLAPHARRGRAIEDYALLAGVLVVSLYAIAETAIKVGLSRPATCTGFPYVTVMLALLLIMPKMLGRATAGKVWETLANRFGGGAAS